jgi:hypothetical protein
MVMGRIFSARNNRNFFEPGPARKMLRSNNDIVGLQYQFLIWDSNTYIQTRPKRKGRLIGIEKN